MPPRPGRQHSTRSSRQGQTRNPRAASIIPAANYHFCLNTLRGITESTPQKSCLGQVTEGLGLSDVRVPVLFGNKCIKAHAPCESRGPFSRSCRLFRRSSSGFSGRFRPFRLSHRNTVLRLSPCFPSTGSDCWSRCLSAASCFRCPTDRWCCHGFPGAHSCRLSCHSVASAVRCHSAESCRDRDRFSFHCRILSLVSLVCLPYNCS